MSLGLFEEEDLGGTYVPKHPKERLIAAYAQELLDHPPVRSLMPEHCPDEDKRRRNARELAVKDISRVWRLLYPTGLEISDYGRVSTYKELLSDWLLWAGEDEGADELIDRSHVLLGTQNTQKGLSQ